MAKRKRRSLSGSSKKVFPANRKRLGPWPVRCGCGKTYDEAAWSSLVYVGIQSGGEEDGVVFPDLELRNCPRPCGSTLAMELAPPAAEDPGIGGVSGAVEDIENVPGPVDETVVNAPEQVQLIDGLASNDNEDDIAEKIRRERYPEKAGWSAGARGKRGEGKKLIDEAAAKKVGHKLELEEPAVVPPTPPPERKLDLDGGVSAVSDDEWADKLAPVLADAVWESIRAQEQQELVRKHWHPGVKDAELQQNWWLVLHDVLGENPDKTGMPFRARVGAVDILVRRSIADAREWKGVTLHGIDGGLGALGATPKKAMDHLAEAMASAAAGDFGLADWNLDQALDAGASPEMVDAHRRQFHEHHDAMAKRDTRGGHMNGLGTGDHPSDHGAHHLDMAWTAAEDGDWERVRWQLEEALADGADVEMVRRLDQQFVQMAQGGAFDGLGCVQCGGRGKHRGLG